VGIAKTYEQNLERRRGAEPKRPRATAPPVSFRTPVRSLEWAISRTYHFLQDDGHGWLADLAVREWWDVDKVRLLAELRVVLWEQDYPAETIGKFDR
jgi:hypothetical protein